MRYTLRDFQKKYVRELLDELDNSRAELSKTKKRQAITFSAPTASGKTVMMTALIERVIFGKGGLEDYDNPEVSSDPGAVFLWLSDSPQLNRQSCEKMSSAASNELANRLEVVESSFDAEFFMPGRVYFLNSQKLSVAANLTNKDKGDLRTFTIWDTINNTITRQRTRFFVVIDEAHRGMRRTAIEQAQASTIIQKFIFGSESELEVCPVVIGVSATPERFDAILGGASRTRRSIDIPPQEPRAAGLIKDFILISHTDEKRPTEWTLLGAACKEFSKISEEWKHYCLENNERETVKPILVIQVEDAAAGKSGSRTPLNTLLEVVRQNLPDLGDVNVAHCMESGANLPIGKTIVRYVEPHRIENDEAVRVVIFKMALTTGWDCPRAEVMMSFRSADDSTYIAQLVGRIVRTPLARRMEGNDLLNSVMLYLPFYDREKVKKVVDSLQGEGGESKGSDTGEEGDFQTLLVASGKEALLAIFKTLPTYTSQEGRKISDTRRALRLTFELSVDGYDEDSAGLRNKLRDKLLSIGKARREKGSLDALVEGLSTVKYRVLVVEDGIPKPDSDGEEKTLNITQEDVESVFSRCFLTLTEELSRSYISSRYNSEDPNFQLWRCKLEAFLLSQDASVVNELENKALQLVEDELEKKKGILKELPPERQAAYKRLLRVSRQFKSTEPLIPTPLRLKIEQEAKAIPDHLFVDDKAEFKVRLNSWEELALAAARADSQFVSWLRNYPRKSWSIAYVYEYKGERKPGYPDLVVFRKNGEYTVVDLMEPHRGEDSLAKAHGLCKYAEDHGENFGRIDWIKIEGKLIKRLNLNSPSIRKQVLAANVDSALDSLFASIGTSESIIQH